MKKLLNKTLRPFIIYSLLILMLSIPAYFFIVNYIWKNELDTYHEVSRDKIEQELNRLASGADSTNVVELFNRFQFGGKLTPALPHTVRKDSVYSYYRYDDYHKEEEFFRALLTQIMIGQKPYTLVIETNVEEEYETAFFIGAATFFLFLILLAGFILLNRRLSMKIWKPFYSTLALLKNFDLAGQKNLDFQKSDISEFEELNAGLNKLIEQNISTYREQKEFTENASHELQTPLAILKSKIDVLLQDGALTEQQLEKIAALNKPLARVSHVNKNLLLLAKIENRQFADNETVSVSELLTENIDFLSEHIQGKRITIHQDIQNNVQVHANKSLVEILLTNLLLNAIRHNAENGKLRVKLEKNTLTVSNTGDQPLNSTTLFKRFITSSSTAPSSGLGLAIVKEICNRYGWQIEYRFEQGLHVFSVRF